MNELFKQVAAYPLMYSGLLLIFGAVGVDQVLEIDPAASGMAGTLGILLILASLWRNRNTKG